MRCRSSVRGIIRNVHARFHVPTVNDEGDIVLLPDEEARHLTQVLRLRSGARIRVFNGRGREFDAVVVRAGKKQVEVQVGATRKAAAEARVAITLAQAVLKRDKMDDVVRDAVMMGAAAIQPVVTARSEITLASLSRARRLDRWHSIAVASAKQCGRAVVPAILEPLSFEAAVASLAALTLPSPCLMFVEPGAAVTAAPIGELDPVPPPQATVLIGPEGGWSADEIERGAAVSRQVVLGSRTLRADAVATVALTALFTLWRDL
jgi:16S rRNA (uracil1498-N3)-methyltransferase